LPCPQFISILILSFVIQYYLSSIYHIHFLCISFHSLSSISSHGNTSLHSALSNSHTQMITHSALLAKLFDHSDVFGCRWRSQQ
jgi:hypothetical protein